MCASVVHRPVFVHTRARVGHTKNKKEVPLLQTEERFKSKRARARWRAVGSVAVGNYYKLSDSELVAQQVEQAQAAPEAAHQQTCQWHVNLNEGSRPGIGGARCALEPLAALPVTQRR